MRNISPSTSLAALLESVPLSTDAEQRGELRRGELQRRDAAAPCSRSAAAPARPGTSWRASWRPGSAAAHASKKSASGRSAHEQLRVVRRQAVLALEARQLRARQLGQRLRASARCSASRRAQRRQVRLGEVAVVVRLFLGAHRRASRRAASRRAASPAHLAARLEHVHLAGDLVLDGLLDEAERVEVLELGARARTASRPCASPRRWRRSGTSPPPGCRRSRPGRPARRAAP